MDRAAAIKARIAAKQRRTLGSGSRLIDALIQDPTQAYKTQPRRASPRDLALKQVWKRAMGLGGPADPSAKWQIGMMFTSMFQNEIGVQDEDKWQPVKPLGNGSFGAAGLFKRVDDVGETDDCVVAKHAYAAKHDVFDYGYPNISREAAIMMQLNEVGNPAILYLRNYRYNENAQQYFYYLEYCPSLGTDFVRLNYKAMKQPIPETFLWFVFYGFAKGLLAMENGPFGDYLDPNDRQTQNLKQRFVVHRDIKPDNVFLGYAPSSTEPGISAAARYMGDTLQYPYLKIADFGLSVITSLGEEMNKMRYHFGVGSRIWFPPEQRANEMTNMSWNPFQATCYLDQNAPDFQRNHAYTPSGNTFAAGFVMYQLITLDEPDAMSNYLSMIMRQQEPEPSSTVLDTGEIPVRNDWLRQNLQAYQNGTSRDPSDYARRVNTFDMLLRWRRQTSRVPELARLVERCMIFKPENRISAANLLREIERMMLLKVADLLIMSQDDRETATRVFTEAADLRWMKKGNMDVEPCDALFWNNLIGGYNWLDPNTPLIRPDLTDQSVTAEALDFFLPGRREQRNRAATRDPPANAPAIGFW